MVNSISHPTDTPAITSFIIRFVHSEQGTAPEVPGRASAAYRGVIRHIQTDEEMTFTRWEDAVTFIQRFVAIELKG